MHKQNVVRLTSLLALTLIGAMALTGCDAGVKKAVTPPIDQKAIKDANPNPGDKATPPRTGAPGNSGVKTPPAKYAACQMGPYGEGNELTIAIDKQSDGFKLKLKFKNAITDLNKNDLLFDKKDALIKGNDFLSSGKSDKEIVEGTWELLKHDAPAAAVAKAQRLGKQQTQAEASDSNDDETVAEEPAAKPKPETKPDTRATLQLIIPHFSGTAGKAPVIFQDTFSIDGETVTCSINVEASYDRVDSVILPLGGKETVTKERTAEKKKDAPATPPADKK